MCTDEIGLPCSYSLFLSPNLPHIPARILNFIPVMVEGSSETTCFTNLTLRIVCLRSVKFSKRFFWKSTSRFTTFRSTENKQRVPYIRRPDHKNETAPAATTESGRQVRQFYCFEFFLSPRVSERLLSIAVIRVCTVHKETEFKPTILFKINNLENENFRRTLDTYDINITNVVRNSEGTPFV